MNRFRTNAGTQRLTAVGLALCVWSVATASAQKVAPAGNGQVTGVSQTVRAGVIARGPGGEQAGVGSFSGSQGNSRVVTGKVAGYGARATSGGLGESASGQGGIRFDTSRDFPQTDFVATMPQLIFQSTPVGGLPGSNFGVTLLPVNTSGTKNAFSSSRARGGKSLPQPKIKDPDAILHPFTHPIGGSLTGGIGTPPATGLGSIH